MSKKKIAVKKIHNIKTNNKKVVKKGYSIVQFRKIIQGVGALDDEEADDFQEQLLSLRRCSNFVEATAKEDFFIYIIKKTHY